MKDSISGSLDTMSTFSMSLMGTTMYSNMPAEARDGRGVWRAWVTNRPGPGCGQEQPPAPTAHDYDSCAVCLRRRPFQGTPSTAPTPVRTGSGISRFWAGTCIAQLHKAHTRVYLGGSGRVHSPLAGCE